MDEKEKIIAVLKKYHYFLIGSHINPDGDSLGSELALASLLKRMGKKVAVVNPNSAPSIYNFLPYKDWITSSCEKDAAEVGIVLDCSEYERLEKVKNLFFSLPIVINIDHHISNKKFGRINFLNTSAGSTGEILYQIFKSFPEQLTKEEALLLYVAILTDTNCFRFGTTASTHKIVSELLSYGLNPREIQEKIYSIPFLAVKLLELIFATIQINKKIAWGEITKEMLNKINSTFGESEDIAQTDIFINYLCSIKDIEVAALFKELDSSPIDPTRYASQGEAGKIKVSLRSKNFINVNKIAQAFNGGGHFRASGCLVSGDIKEVEKKVIAEIEKEMES